jgi:hypothetical protein
MKKILMFFVCLLLGGGIIFGQEITVKKAFGGQQYFLDGKRLTVAQLAETMEGNSEAYSIINNARTANAISMLIGGAGSFMIGYPMGTAAAGGDPNWLLAGIGAGLVAISIPINQKFNKQSRSAIDLYNEGLKKDTGSNGVGLFLGFTETGIGFRLYF